MDLLIKGSTELNKMFAALQNTASGLRRDFGEVEDLQQSLRSHRFQVLWQEYLKMLLNHLSQQYVKQVQSPILL